MRSVYLSRTKRFLISRSQVMFGSVILAILIGLVINGCGGNRPAAELPDPREGTFLTLEEQRKLSSEEIDTYCEILDEYLGELRSEIEFAQFLTDSLTKEIDLLNGEHSALNREKRGIQKTLREKKSQRKGMTEYTTKAGDTLMTLSTLFYGSAAHWRRIFEANEDKVTDPGQELKAGITLKIPQ